MFGRKKKDVGAEGPVDVEGVHETEPDAAPLQGPYDESAVDGIEDRIDFGSVWISPVADMEVRLEVDQATDEVSAIQVGLEDSTVQLQAFAAPRSSGIWDEIRTEIAEMIRSNRGTVEEVQGPFGAELHTRLPQPGPEGRTLFAPAIFAGVDGPRWFLRAVYSGKAAVDEEARRVVDAVLAHAVVVRGQDPRAPREMLPLRMPDSDPR